MNRNITAALGLAALVACTATPSAAASFLLDFGNTGCTFNGGECLIPQTYGDGAGYDVSFQTVSALTGQSVGSLKYWTEYGDLSGVLYAGNDATNFFGELRVTAAAGYKVALQSFDFATFANNTAQSPFAVLDLAGATLAAFTGSTNWPTHGHADVNTAMLDGFVVRWGPDAYNVAIDNVRFSVSAPTGAVPEPSAWALMIIGFGAAGSLLRAQRRSHRRSASVPQAIVG